jgi:hypothetical protein
LLGGVSRDGKWLASRLKIEQVSYCYYGRFDDGKWFLE